MMRTEPIRASCRVAILLAVTTSLVQGGCLSDPVPADRFYRLEVPDAAARLEVPRLGGRLLVDSPRGDGMTLERLMLHRDASDPSRVKRAGYDHWVDSPPAMVQQAVVKFLRSANAAEIVITPAMRLDADFHLAGRVNRFELLAGEGAPRATIELEFSLVRLEDRKLLLLKTYREEEDVGGSGVGDSVEAFSRALHRILRRLTLDLPAS
jgi:ABC-type uncharacterized transport system auxiliary subunit